MLSTKGYYSSSSMVDATIGPVIAIIVAILGGILIYCLFLSKKNEGKFTGFLGWLYDFLSFKKMFLEALLKIAYLITAIYITIMSFMTIGTSFWLFLLIILGGNLLVRIGYEFSLVLLVICKNTTEIAKNTKKNSEE